MKVLNRKSSIIIFSVIISLIALGYGISVKAAKISESFTLTILNHSSHSLVLSSVQAGEFTVLKQSAQVIPVGKAVTFFAVRTNDKAWLTFSLHFSQLNPRLTTLITVLDPPYSAYQTPIVQIPVEDPNFKGILTSSKPGLSSNGWNLQLSAGTIVILDK